MTETQKEIAKICEDVKELLLYKNSKYGNSAIDPIRVFSKSDNTEQLLVRIDDKLNRIKHGENILYDDEDVIQDLIGYLVLLKISLKKASESNGL
jgi:hypothetical protein|tara:strand:+ start:1321 stop:1605 length:285 start_codon:yes stop_codon:yes gene_type:complete